MKKKKILWFIRRAVIYVDNQSKIGKDHRCSWGQATGRVSAKSSKTEGVQI